MAAAGGGAAELPPREASLFKNVVVRPSSFFLCLFCRPPAQPQPSPLGASSGAAADRRLPARPQKFYEEKQYKKGLKDAEKILRSPKFCEHGGTLRAQQRRSAEAPQPCPGG